MSLLRHRLRSVQHDGFDMTSRAGGYRALTRILVQTHIHVCVRGANAEQRAKNDFDSLVHAAMNYLKPRACTSRRAGRQYVFEIQITNRERGRVGVRV